MSGIHDALAGRLQRAGQRYTRVRRALAEVLLAAQRPLTIPEILERSERLVQSSVYRNLQVLEQVGAVRRIAVADDAGARFELAEELTSHHHHLVCRECGALEDFEPSPRLEQALRAAAGAAGDGGFRVDHHRVALLGRCADCGA